MMPGGTEFQVCGSLQRHKRVKESQDCGKSYNVVDSFWNCGNRTVDIKLGDSTGSDFAANETISWPFCYAIRKKRIQTWFLFSVFPI